MKKIIHISILSLALVVFSVQASEASITVKDTAGRMVQTPSDPSRIVCLGTGTLRLIVYLQAEDKVAGVEDMEKMNPMGRPYWIAHPEMHDLPRCGPGGPASINKKPDLEAIMAIYPEVIFVTYMDVPLADEVQDTLGIPVVVLSYGPLGTFNKEVYDSLEIAGRVLNRENRARKVINYIESIRVDLDERTAGIQEKEKPDVFVGGIGYRGSYGIESTEKDYIPLDWANTPNLAEKVKGRVGTHVFVGEETLLNLNPDIIFVDSGGLSLVAEDYRKKKDFYHTIKAFTNREVYTLLPYNFYATNIGTALADAYAIGKILYKNNFRDIKPETKADEIYTFMVGKPVYGQMEKDFVPLGGRLPFLD